MSQGRGGVSENGRPGNILGAGEFMRQMGRARAAPRPPADARGGAEEPLFAWEKWHRAEDREQPSFGKVSLCQGTDEEVSLTTLACTPSIFALIESISAL